MRKEVLSFFLKRSLLWVSKGFFNISKAFEREEYTELWIKIHVGYVRHLMVLQRIAQHR